MRKYNFKCSEYDVNYIIFNILKIIGKHMLYIYAYEILCTCVRIDIFDFIFRFVRVK